MPIFSIACLEKDPVRRDLGADYLAGLANEVHIWVGNTNECSIETSLMNKLVSQEELTRAEQFHFSKSRKQYLYSRAFLRLILSRYLGICPASIQFGRMATGKPYLINFLQGIYFNLSHSENQIVISISKYEIGIDIEYIRNEVDWTPIAGKYFGQQETEKLLQQNTESATEQFYELWTRKEAFLKATGLGLVNNLQDIDLSNPVNQVLLEDARLDKNIPAQWFLLSHKLAEKYVLSVVLPSSDLDFLLVDVERLLFQPPYCEPN